MFPAAYFAPTYFPHTYFAEPPLAIQPNSYFGRSYFAPSYFAPSYFPRNNAASGLVDYVGQIFGDFQSLLAGAGIAPAKAVILSLLDEPFPAAGFPQLVITPGPFSPMNDELFGGGRYTSNFSSTFQVGCWVRNATDQAYQDTNLLTDQVRGAYLLANHVVDQLLEYFPASPVSGLPIVVDGIKFEGYDEPQRWSDDESSQNRALDAGGIITHWSFAVRMSLTGAP